MPPAKRTYRPGGKGELWSPKPMNPELVNPYPDFLLMTRGADDANPNNRREVS